MSADATQTAADEFAADRLRAALADPLNARCGADTITLATADVARLLAQRDRLRAQIEKLLDRAVGRELTKMLSDTDLKALVEDAIERELTRQVRDAIRRLR